jgi:hypothetical protein
LPVHRVTSWGWSSVRGRVLSGAWIGVLTFVVPPDLVDEAVGDGLAWEMRLRALPARLGVYFVLGLCLFSAKPYPDVIREVTAGLQAGLAAAGWETPAATALTRARARIGETPLRSLLRRLCSALSPGRSPWSHIGGLLAVAVDGTTISTYDSAENAAAFGRPATPRRRPVPVAGPGKSANPQLRLVTLIACGTRGLLDAAIGPARGKGTGERALAGQLLGTLQAGMLLLADRNFYSYQLWNAAAATGADLLWRVRDSMHLPVVRQLPDGSYLAHINDPRAVQARAHKNGTRRRRGSPLPPDTGPLPGITVRVIEYVLTVTAEDGSTRAERYRHLTTLTDWRAHPAADLAGGYAWRWAIETGYRECKTYLRGSGRVLRGRTPALARQELWALLVIYQALRVIIVRAAASRGLDPDRISFTAALNAAQRTMNSRRDQLTATLAATEAEILSCPVPQRDGRICARAVNKPVSPYPSKHRHTGPISQHAAYTVTITTPDHRTGTTTDQARQPRQRPDNPPLNSWHWAIAGSMFQRAGSPGGSETGW